VDDATRIVDALRRYGQDAARLGQAFSALHDLQPADLRALVEISRGEREGAPLTPSRLREHLRLSAGGTSVVIDRLERAGHVARTRDHPSDHRVVHLRQTATGSATTSAFFGPLGALLGNVVASLSPAETAAAAKFMEAAAAALEAHLITLESRTDPTNPRR
jgi:DNA-binding MarR family transcriptional regulator